MAVACLSHLHGCEEEEEEEEEELYLRLETRVCKQSTRRRRRVIDKTCRRRRSRITSDYKQEKQLFNHCKNDPERQAHILLTLTATLQQRYLVKDSS